jgi:NDP-sugar pyrophosphorylase family protein
MAESGGNDAARVPVAHGPGTTTAVHPDLKSMNVMLQAGGKGERLRNGSALPKPLFPVGGRPMIERLVRQVAEAGARDLSVVTGFGADQVERAVRAIRGLPADLTVRFIRERIPRGNAGSLSLAPRDKACLFCFADLVTDIDFARLASVHAGQRVSVTLASHYEFLQVRLGELTADGDRVVSYREKPIHRVLIASGVAVFEPAVLDLVPKDQPAGLSDVVQAAIDHGLPVSHWLHGSSWIDVNTPDELETARQLVGADAQVV